MIDVCLRPYTVPEITPRQFRRARHERDATQLELCGLCYAVLLGVLERMRCPLELAETALEMIADDLQSQRLERSLTWADEADYPPLYQPYQENFRSDGEEEDCTE